jgi:LmbE family N-acetylglucosaminyl deacetylase
MFSPIKISKQIFRKIIHGSLHKKGLLSKRSKKFNLRVMPEPLVDQRILLVVAHPDDEWISCAGYLQRAKKIDAKVKIILVTNGEGSPAYFYFDSGRLHLTDKFFLDLGKRRAEETKRALGSIDISDQEIIFFGYPAGRLFTLLTKNWIKPFRFRYLKTNRVPYDFVFEPQTLFTGENLVASLGKIISEFKPDILITHGLFDDHKDHQTVYWVVKQSLGGIRFSPKTYFFIIHNRGFSVAEWLELKKNLAVPGRLRIESLSWFSFGINKEEMRIKKRGVNSYKTQLKNPYLNVLLKSFSRPNELFYIER